MQREVLFKTPHGSHLYGLSHADSDEDFYTVVTKKVPRARRGRQTRARYARQTISGGQDNMMVDFGTWMEMCKSGVPQALEAMFSNMVLGEDRIAALRSSFRCGTQAHDRYLRTIKSFALSEDDSTKKRRHALRLALNLNEMARRGRFNPTLSQSDILYINSMSQMPHEDVYRLALRIAWQQT